MGGNLNKDTIVGAWVWVARQATYQEARGMLETAYVDQYDLNGVLEMLADICYEKAEHVRTNWQDKALAKIWERKAARINKAIL